MSQLDSKMRMAVPGHRDVTVNVGGFDCPVCSRFFRMTRLCEAVGPVLLVDARNGGCIWKEVERNGFNLDDGLALRSNGHKFNGADAAGRQ